MRFNLLAVLILAVLVSGSFAATWANDNCTYSSYISFSNFKCEAGGYCQGHNFTTFNISATNGSDLIIYDNTNTTELYHWLSEDWDYSTASGQLFINATNGTEAGWAYYKCTGGYTGSSIDKTFIFSDNFNGVSLNTSNWNLQGANWTFANGMITLKTPNTGDGMTSQINLGYSVSILAKTTRNNGLYGVYMGAGANTNSQKFALNPYTGSVAEMLYGTAAQEGFSIWQATNVYYNTSANINNGVYSIWQIDAKAQNSIDYYAKNITTYATLVQYLTNTNTTSANNYIGFGSCCNRNITIDYLVVMRYSSSNPSFSIIGQNLKTPPSNGSIIALSQTPTQITSTNLFSQRLNITYNITNGTSNPPSLFHALNSSIRSTVIFVNGTGYTGFDSSMVQATNLTPYANNTTTTWQFLVSDNVVYPATYNMNESYVENTQHINIFNLTNPSSGYAANFLNVSNLTTYNYLEVMANSSTEPFNVYYCNNSYSTITGGSVESSPYCVQFATIAANTPYNHTHGAYAAHIVIPFPINTTSGTVQGSAVSITSVSYFVLKGTGAGTVYLWGLPIKVRDNSMATSGDGGVSWTDASTTTLDMHLHQFSGSDNLYYYAQSNLLNGSVYQNSSIVSASLTPAPLPPTNPFIDYPKIGLYKNNNSLFINYTAAQVSSGGIANYIVQLYTFTNNTTEIYPAFDINLTSISGLNYTWNTTFTANASNAVYKCDATNSSAKCRTYYGFVRVIANSTDGLTSYADSPIFALYDTNITYYSNSQAIYTTNYTVGESYKAVANLIFPRYSVFFNSCGNFTNPQGCLNISITGINNYLNASVIGNMTYTNLTFNGDNQYMNDTITRKYWDYDRGVRYVYSGYMPIETAQVNLLGSDNYNFSWKNYNATFFPTIYSSTQDNYLYSGSNNQTITIYIINLTTNCTAPNKNILNFLFYNQSATGQAVNSTMGATFFISPLGGNLTYNFSINYTNVQLAQVCLSVPFGIYRVDSVQQFQDSASTTRPLYYYLLNQTINATQTLNTSLYNLDNSVAYLMKYTVLDSSNAYVQGVYLQVYRYYPATNQLILVSMGKTDNVGSANTYLVPNDINYRVIVVDNNANVQYETNTATVPCALGSAQCTQTIQIGSAYENPYSQFIGEMGTGCTYDNTTLNLICTSNNPSGTGRYLNLNVWEFTQLGRVLVCNNGLAAGSGSVICVLPNSNSTFYYTFTSTIGSDVLADSGYINNGGINTNTLGGVLGILITAGMITILGGIGVLFGFSGAIVGAVAGLVFAFFMGLIAISWTIIATISVLGLIIAYILRQ